VLEFPGYGHRRYQGSCTSRPLGQPQAGAEDHAGRVALPTETTFHTDHRSEPPPEHNPNLLKGDGTERPDQASASRHHLALAVATHRLCFLYLAAIYRCPIPVDVWLATFRAALIHTPTLSALMALTTRQVILACASPRLRRSVRKFSLRWKG